MITRNIGTQMSGNAIKRLEKADAEILFNHPHLVLAAQNNIAVIHFLKQRIPGIERELTVPGKDYTSARWQRQMASLPQRH